MLFYVFDNIKSYNDVNLILILSVIFLLLYLSLEPAVGIQEDRKKVPWSDKETIILLELWGDPQVEHINIIVI